MNPLDYLSRGGLTMPGSAAGPAAGGGMPAPPQPSGPPMGAMVPPGMGPSGPPGGQAPPEFKAETQSDGTVLLRVMNPDGSMGPVVRIVSVPKPKGQGGQPPGF